MPEAVITGVAEVGVAGSLLGEEVNDAIASTARAAVTDAGLEPAAIDGLITIVPRADQLTWHGGAVASALGLSPRFVFSMAQGGSAILMLLYQAAAAIEGGLATRVLILAVDQMRTAVGRSGAVASMADAGFRSFERPYGLSVPAAFALLARRHMHDYGTSSEDLARVAVAMRAHAAQHPNAQAREPLTVDAVVESRMIAAPLHLLDCSLVSDGGGALLVEATSDDSRAVQVLGWAEAHGPEWVTERPSAAELRAGTVSAEEAFSRARVARDDVDVALIYDPFTISTVTALEDLGFCERGESGAFVASGAITLDGAIPVNPHGGLLSHSHPGRPAAVLHLVEAVRQLRGEALGAQVPDAALAVVTAEGAMLGANATVVLGR